MTISLKHAKTSQIVDSSNDELVRPSDWNAEHVLTLTGPSLLGRDDANNGVAEELTAAQVLVMLGTAGLYQPLDADLTAIAALSPSNDDIIQRKSSAWTNRTMAQLIADLAALGTTFQPLDADLTAVAALSPSNDDIIQRKAGVWTNRTIAQLIADLAALGTTFQPLDADLTAIAALSTTAYGCSLLTLVDDDALAAEISEFYQPLDADLTAIAALATAAFGRSLLTQATAEAARTTLVVGLPPGFVSVRYSQAADTDHDITFAVGKARDSTDAFDMVLAGALTKQIDASWTVGTNQGGMDTGSVGNNTIYYLWLIARSDTGVVDALFSTSATAPTMPANYDRKQRVGWVRTDGSANIRAFVQAINDLDETRYVTPILDVNVNNLGETSTSYALSVPPTSEAIFRAGMREPNSNPNAVVLIRPLTETDQVPSVLTALASLVDLGSGYYNHGIDAGEFRVETNASSQIAARVSDITDNAIEFYVATRGAKFLRGIIP